MTNQPNYRPASQPVSQSVLLGGRKLWNGIKFTILKNLP